jgi:3-hydroxybutyryl-CoA dehydrogenase
MMQIAIIGLGANGVEIAHAVALGGDEIILHDTDERVLRVGLAKISRAIDQGVRLGKVDAFTARRVKRAFILTTDLQKCAAADMVIEAIPDTLNAKQKLFRTLDDLAARGTILATSTNTISVTRLAATTRHPARVLGLHFFKPAHIIQLVEIVRGLNSATEAVDQAADLVRRMGKTPVVLADAPGLIVNRVAITYCGEALHLLDQGALDEETIDKLMEAAGFPMGPFRLMDYLGVDRVFEVAQTMYEATFHATPYRPHPRIQRLVEAGRLGRKSPRGGFYPDTDVK